MWTRTTLPLALALLAGLATPPAFAERVPAPAVDAAPPGPVPAFFEPNRGQADPAVRFLSRGRGYTLFLTRSGLVLSLRPSSGSGSPAVLRMALLDSRPDSQIAGSAPLPGLSHYLRGSDPAAWHTAIPHYRRVVYRGVYPDVDLALHASGARLEYDFIVGPGADPAAIQLTFDGADALEIDGRGDLVLHFADGALVQRAPVAYQEIEGTRRPVQARFVVIEPMRVGFDVASHEPGVPLVIDPVVDYATYLGGTDNDSVTGVGVDASGNVYLTGITSSLDYPTQAPFQGSFAGVLDAFVTKLTPDGAGLVYSTYLGGSGNDPPNGLAVDATGHAYVTGSTSSLDYPVVNAHQPIHGGTADAYVTKLAPSGDSLVYSTYLGGSSIEAAWGIATDANGNAYVASETTSTDHPTLNAVQPALAGFRDGVVAKYDPNGVLLYSTFLGGSNLDILRAIAADSAGNAVVVGDTASADFPTVNAVQPAFAGDRDVTITKLDAAGTSILFSTYYGGSRDDRGFSVAVGAAGNAFASGRTFSADFPTLNAFQPSLAGNVDAFVIKLTPAGTGVLYSTYLGGSDGENALEQDGGLFRSGGIAADATGAAYVVGSTKSADFPLLDAFQASLDGLSDAFVVKLAPGGQQVYGSYLGGGALDSAQDLALDAGGSVYFGGLSFSTDFPTTAGAFQTLPAGGAANGWVAKVALGPDVLECEVLMSQIAYVDGETVVADVLRFANPSSVALPARLTLDLALPIGFTIPLLDLGAGGGFFVPASFEANLSPVTLFTVQAGQPRGGFSFDCGLLDPVTGVPFASDSGLFELQ